MEKIIKTAKNRKAEAIHPGYGFLAENHRFSKRCEEEQIVFIGPGSKALRLVGDKVASRKTISKIGAPIIPGMDSTGKDIKEFQQQAEKIGYPVMIKASAGGGGKGMRIVQDPNNLKSALEAGMREAKSAFGDESVYLEKYIEKPRHVEFQVLADHHGNAIHLFERECSIQRRHQKIVEETPSTAVDPDLRQRMGGAAVEVIRATGYTNAGTVEFLLDKNKDFYFLEVNARIQVEHPITEMVTGIDLVKWQIRIASDEKLTLKQEDLSQRGHAIECRIYAEDPANGFLPSLGKVPLVKKPEGPGIRVDSGIFSGCEVTRFYDPILSKLIVWGENREDSRKRMQEALSSYSILGIKTTIPFLKDVIAHPKFISGETRTNFIDKNLSKWSESLHENKLNLALIAAALKSELKNDSTGSKKVIQFSPWTTLGKWRIGEHELGVIS
jgi:acetyl/propionyl-CoA carboxylase alpha subunit